MAHFQERHTVEFIRRSAVCAGGRAEKDRNKGKKPGVSRWLRHGLKPANRHVTDIVALSDIHQSFSGFLPALSFVPLVLGQLELRTELHASCPSPFSSFIGPSQDQVTFELSSRSSFISDPSF